MSTENQKKKEIAERLFGYRLRQHGLLDRKIITCLLCGEEIVAGQFFYDGITERGHADCVDNARYPNRSKNANTGMSNCV